MIIELFLSLAVLCSTTVMCIRTSGGFPRFILEPGLLPGILAILALMIFLGGYGKAFLKIFSSPKKIKETDLSGLKKTETALSYAFKALALICFFLMIIAGIYFYLNFFETQTLGFNLSIMLCSIYYMAFFGMLFLTLKAKLRTNIINFMADDSEPEKVNQISKKQRLLCIGKIIISIALIICFYNFIIYTSAANNSGLEPLSINYLIDIPGLIYIFIPGFLLLAISGNFKIFFRALKYAVKNTKLSVSQKAVSINAIQFLQKVLLLDGIMCIIGGYIAILTNLEDKAALGPNFMIASLPLIYALLIDLILLPVESKISLLCDAE